MDCTSCNVGSLEPSFIEGQFRAHTCTSCKGNWILIEDYVSWKERNPEYQFSEQCSFQEDGTDSKKALLCPSTGTIMRKFKISSATEHRIDYSANAGGLWLDAGEWELLKKEGLAGSLNSVISQHWQNKIREQSAKDNFADIYLEKFGAENYTKIKEFRQWLDKQEQKADLRAYILAEDPYSAEK
ncbi:zf-TFIIB domain-containing protein [Psychromonas aquimarina]|uniref:zf-TFIIB domain-containing protein n=1 Tax=Psychromonas aquimarina TaxID=444919 RepID=UPI000412FA77|nr:zf-TFIIB domain-containing protein [Psychromonas aquimarina]